MDLVCKDCERLLDYGFIKLERSKGYPPIYYWNANGVHDGHIDITVEGCRDQLENGKMYGWFSFYRINKTIILPKLIQLANVGLCENRNIEE